MGQTPNQALVYAILRPLRRRLGVLALAAATALANYFVWGWMGAPIAAPDVVGGRVGGVGYAAFGRADAPWVRHTSPEILMAADLRQLAGVTSEIRTYTAAQFPELPKVAASEGLRLTLGAWLNRDEANNQREIAAATDAARAHKNIVRLVVGNETILKEIFTPRQLTQHLRRARAASPVPVSTAEPWHVWIKHPELAAEVDFITIHLLPYWEGVGIDTAVDESFERLARVRARFPGKPILIGEIGYPSRGDTIKRAEPSPAAQAAFVRQFVTRAQQDKLD